MGIVDFLGSKAGAGVTQAAGLGIDTAFGIWDRATAWKQQQLENDRWQDTFDYEKALQEEIFDREDTSYQRAVRDATSAGLSPVGITGTDSGQIVNTNSQNNSQFSTNPTQALQFARQLTGALNEIKSMEIKEDELKNTITFTNAQIDKIHADAKRADTQQMLDFALASQQQHNALKLGMLDLEERGKSREQSKKLHDAEMALKNSMFQFDRLKGLHGMSLSTRQQNFNENAWWNDYWRKKDAHDDEMNMTWEMIEQGYLGMLKDIGMGLLQPFTGGIWNIPYGLGGSNSKSKSK